jgi:hypothetical protein
LNRQKSAEAIVLRKKGRAERNTRNKCGLTSYVRQKGPKRVYLAKSRDGIPRMKQVCLVGLGLNIKGTKVRRMPQFGKECIPNRRIPNGTYGGVGGRGFITPSYPISLLQHINLPFSYGNPLALARILTKKEMVGNLSFTAQSKTDLPEY